MGFGDGYVKRVRRLVPKGYEFADRELPKRVEVYGPSGSKPGCSRIGAGEEEMM